MVPAFIRFSNRRWLKQIGLDTPDLGHLKRIRKQDEVATLLLGISLDPPTLPVDLDLPTPYLLSVPTSSALTLPSLNLKSALWPTLYTPRRKDEPEQWTRSRLRWAWDAMKKTVDAALTAQTENGEVRVDPFCALFVVKVVDMLDYSCLLPGTYLLRSSWRVMFHLLHLHSLDMILGSRQGTLSGMLLPIRFNGWRTTVHSR